MIKRVIIVVISVCAGGFPRPPGGGRCSVICHLHSLCEKEVRRGVKGCGKRLADRRYRREDCGAQGRQSREFSGIVSGSGPGAGVFGAQTGCQAVPREEIFVAKPCAADRVSKVGSSVVGLWMLVGVVVFSNWMME